MKYIVDENNYLEALKKLQKRLHNWYHVEKYWYGNELIRKPINWFNHKLHINKLAIKASLCVSFEDYLRYQNGERDTRARMANYDFKIVPAIIHLNTGVCSALIIEKGTEVEFRPFQIIIRTIPKFCIREKCTYHFTLLPYHISIEKIIEERARIEAEEYEMMIEEERRRYEENNECDEDEIDYSDDDFYW